MALAFGAFGVFALLDIGGPSVKRFLGLEFRILGLLGFEGNLGTARVLAWCVPRPL